ncbi:unnamed protein product, partial [Rotaria sp. Silwood2]
FSIQCNLYPNSISVDSEINENNFPSLANYSLINAQERLVTINWYRNNLGSIVVYTVNSEFEQDKIPNEILLRIFNSSTLFKKFSSILIEVSLFVASQCFHYKNPTICSEIDLNHCKCCLIKDDLNKT